MSRDYLIKLIQDAMAKFLPNEKVMSDKGVYPFVCDQNEEFWLVSILISKKSFGYQQSRDGWELTQNFGDGNIERVGLYDNEIQAAPAFVSKVLASRMSAHFERVSEDEMAKEYTQ